MSQLLRRGKDNSAAFQILEAYLLLQVSWQSSEHVFVMRACVAAFCIASSLRRAAGGGGMGGAARARCEPACI